MDPEVGVKGGEYLFAGCFAGSSKRIEGNEELNGRRCKIICCEVRYQRAETECEYAPISNRCCCTASSEEAGRKNARNGGEENGAYCNRESVKGAGKNITLNTYYAVDEATYIS